MFRYAQIDIETGVCISVSLLSGEFVADHMIPLFKWVDKEQPGEPDEDGNPTTIIVPEVVMLDIEVNPGDTYADGVWTPAPPPEPVDPQPTPVQIKIAQLEQDNINLMLAITQVYEEKEAEKAAAEQETINNMLAITELYEMILALQGGVE
ncbi:hypothetical protein ACFPES_03260 [Paenibacillus sp. GCM10023248]|uniref:hypothetical protein n=1 Tax=unclassified Paenibacillus TaxID=185978 RepID=UPI0023794FAF|nr:hypothetical protein [Paenibacillus sp. MAHUQ-63]MDD9266044.1 hypothetical protein [Paenibacillus sp. MAHUQ-63]